VKQSEWRLDFPTTVEACADPFVVITMNRKEKNMRGVGFVMALAVVLLHPRAGSGVDEGELKFLMEKEDSMTREEYIAGMDQKKLSLEKDDVAGALREVLWETCSAIAVGDGYSVVLQTRQAHPIVAEYHRRVMVFLLETTGVAVWPVL
jgi:hypothetical protein